LNMEWVLLGGVGFTAENLRLQRELGCDLMGWTRLVEVSW
jgi:hypothetical protein